MIKKVRLKTKTMFESFDKSDIDYQLWQDIAEYMDGEVAYVSDSMSEPGKYVFCGLDDDKKNKELSYMLEQDRMFGIYIDDREGFDEAWDNGKYEPDGGLFLEASCIEDIGEDNE